jgi:hypothetical protein
MGEEAATPGQPAALARFSEVVPRRFTLENRRSAAGSAAIIRQAQKRPRFSLKPTLSHFVAACNIKVLAVCAEAVDVETSLWKGEEN